MKGAKAGLLASGWPRTTVVCLVGLASSILSALILTLLKGFVDIVKVLLLGIAGIWLPSLFFFMFQSFIMGGEVMNFKRGLNSLSVLMIFMLMTTLLGFIAHLIGIIVLIEDLIFIGIALIASLNALVYRYMTGKSLVITWAISIMWPVIISITISLLLGTTYVEMNHAKMLLVLIFMVLPTIALSRSIDKLSESLVGMSSKKVFKAYVANWFTETKEDLESFFNRISTTFQVSCDLVALLNSKGTIEGIIAIPQVHPGPLRGIGSSSLPSDLISTIKSTCNTKSVVFHGFTTHASDITSSKDYSKLLELMRKAVTQLSYPAISGPSSHLVRVDVEGLSIGCQFIKGLPMIFVSGNERGIDDIPETFGKKVEQEIEEIYGIRPILINAHNQYEEDAHVDLEELRRGILKAVELAFKSSSHESIRIGVGEAENLNLNEFQGIGPSGIRVLITEFKGSRYCYVVIDANNANKEFRDSIGSIVKSMGYKDCELFTTDSHMVVHLRGVKSSRGYHVLGEKVNVKEILNALRTAIREAEESLFEANILRGRIETEARVLGDIAYRNIEKLLTQSVDKFKKLGLMGYGTAIAASFLICWLL
ncbi:MAG: DUF2070 family protein [Candidatus Nezhaarchaeales archaeon]|nr:MAG: hypothetical protein DSO06_00950 [Candidatus Nezhaarchaeota archaeon WYZ-LMO8]TDA37374.1 MAG: hypothetical protein DSO05_00225 [Candidatus Nezhaarchaeota archaeon WYZ-LMO7]